MRHAVVGLDRMQLLCVTQSWPPRFACCWMGGRKTDGYIWSDRERRGWKASVFKKSFTQPRGPAASFFQSKRKNARKRKREQTRQRGRDRILDKDGKRMNEKARVRWGTNVSGIRQRKNATSFSPLLNSLANLPSSLPCGRTKKLLGLFPFNQVTLQRLPLLYVCRRGRELPHFHTIIVIPTSRQQKNVISISKMSNTGQNRHVIKQSTQLFLSTFFCTAVYGSIYKGKLCVVFVCKQRARARLFVCFCLTISKV